MSCEAAEYGEFFTGQFQGSDDAQDDDVNTVTSCNGSKATAAIHRYNRSQQQQQQRPEACKPRYLSLQVDEKTGRYQLTEAKDGDDVVSDEERVNVEDLLRQRLNTILECDEEHEEILHNVLSRSAPREFHDASARWLPKSIGIYLMYLAMGLCASIFGPTMVNLESHYETDTRTLSFTLTGSGLGYLIGAIISGLTFDRFNCEIQFAVTAGVGALTTAGAPFIGSVYGFIALMTLQSIALGYMDTGGNAYALSLWRGQQRQNPLLQGMYLMWSLGSTITPFIATPFLIHQPGANTTNYYNSSVPLRSYGTEIDVVNDTYDVGLVRYVYVIISTAMLGCMVVFLALFLTERPVNPFRERAADQHNRVNSKTEATGTAESGQWRRHRTACLMVLFAYCFLYYGMECTCGNFLSPFLMKQFGWNPDKAAVLTAVFWGCLGLGRLTSIPISTHLSPKHMLIMNSCITTIAFLLLLLAKYQATAMLWLSIILAGYGLSNTFATTILWASAYISITGRAASVLVVGGSLASMVLPPVVGYLFEAVTPLCFAYALVALCLSHGFMFVLCKMVLTQTGWFTREKQPVLTD